MPHHSISLKDCFDVKYSLKDLIVFFSKTLRMFLFLATSTQKKLKNLQDLLISVLSSFTRINVHSGMNYAVPQQLELTESDFSELLNFLHYKLQFSPLVPFPQQVMASINQEYNEYVGRSSSLLLFLQTPKHKLVVLLILLPFYPATPQQLFVPKMLACWSDQQLFKLKSEVELLV